VGLWSGLLIGFVAEYHIKVSSLGNTIFVAGALCGPFGWECLVRWPWHRVMLLAAVILDSAVGSADLSQLDLCIRVRTVATELCRAHHCGTPEEWKDREWIIRRHGAIDKNLQGLGLRPNGQGSHYPMLCISITCLPTARVAVALQRTTQNKGLSEERTAVCIEMPRDIRRFHPYWVRTRGRHGPGRQ